jgi:membrane-bound acyltransferase YfiQ involved in biofilm formation
MARPWFAWLSAFSFIIYALHAPFIAYFINPVIALLQPFEGARLAAFVLLPLLVIALCVGLGALLRALLPKTYSLLTGGRGF